MYRGQGTRAKRTARRLLLQAGLDVPDSLKPGKAVDDLPEPEKAEAKALQKRLKELRFSRKFSTCEVEWEVSQIKGRLHELLGPSSLEEDEEDELETANQVNKRLLQTIQEAKEWAEQCKPTVKEEPAEAAQPAAAEPGQAAAVEVAEAPAVGEPGKADAVDEPGKVDEPPTGDTEESAEEEEEEDWVTVGDKKRRRKNQQKKPKISLSLQRLSTFLFSLQRLHLQFVNPFPFLACKGYHVD